LSLKCPACKKSTLSMETYDRKRTNDLNGTFTERAVYLCSNCKFVEVIG